MSVEIAPGVRYMTREDWGARTDIPRLGEAISPGDRTEAIHHHTVAIDNDATPNLWETEAETKPKMRQLQTIRPDLGLDVPYNFVAFLMHYHLGARGIILCEGRGADRRGAHTKYHNRTGIAVAIEGNLELAVNVEPYVEMLSAIWGWIKDEHGLVNLGSVRPPRGQVWGHQQFAQTACPGASLMIELADITIGLEPEQETDMTVYRLFQTWGPAQTWLIAYVNTPAGDVPIYRRWLLTQAGVAKLSAVLGEPKTIGMDQLQTIPVL